MKHLKIIFLGIGLIFSFTAQGQDFHFSQFNNSPLNLNPALTGCVNGKARVIANYRNQWTQLLQNDAYQTLAISYDSRVNFKSGDYFGIGASYFGDVGGSIRFGTIQANLSLSFAKTISKKGLSTHTIVGGFQSGTAQRKIDENGFRWPTQVDSNGIMTNYIPSGELATTDFLYLDLNAGLFLLSRFGERKNFFAGVSAFHVNKPNISFQHNAEEPLSTRISFHAGSELPISSQFSFLPSMMFLRQGLHSQLNIGALVKFINFPQTFISNIQGGIFYRAGKDLSGRIHSDAIISVLSLQVKGVQLGFSYDFTISELNYNRLGSLEFSVGYIFGTKSQQAGPFDIPQL